MPSLLLTDKEIISIYNRHVDTVYRICYSFMKNASDTEDMVQETFLRLIASGKKFQSESHEKAWLIVTASNLCKDTLKKWWRKWEDIEDPSLGLKQEAFEPDSTLSAILSLPADYKAVVYMYYYEDYTTEEIAEALHCPHSTVRSRLARARKRLQSILGGESK